MLPRPVEISFLGGNFSPPSDGVAGRAGAQFCRPCGGPWRPESRKGTSSSTKAAYGATPSGNPRTSVARTSRLWAWGATCTNSAPPPGLIGRR